MQRTRKTDIRTKKEPKDDTKKKQDEKLKRGAQPISTPKNFIQKSTTVDIYAQQNKISPQNARAPKKVLGTVNTSSDSSIKGFLKSSASSVSQISKSNMTSKKKDLKTLANSAKRNETSSKQLLTNVTVNSPAAKRRLDLNAARVINKEAGSLKNFEKSNEVGKLSRQGSTLAKTNEVRKEPTKAIGGERQRSKTRTLEENEVKIFTSDVVDNNAGMLNLSQKLVAEPKVFYVAFDENKDKSKMKNDKTSDEDVSYEDDFESYESDFESYHSDQTDLGGTSESSDKSRMSETNRISEKSEQNVASVEDSSLKEKDEEKMLDSGNFDLRDQRSVKSKPAVLDFILEDGENRKTVSLTDEGFQDMSSSSAGSSLKTQQVDRALFIDMSNSKRGKLKRKIHARLQQRAKDLLGMITLHEMSYSLFEMQPISYDLYMATFGRSNYTQIGVQTFDDGITVENQTDEVAVSRKWTQHPVEFSKSDVYTSKDVVARKYSKHTEDYLTKFTFMMKTNVDKQYSSKISMDENYKMNPLRVLLEQKDGVGGDEMLPFERYKSKLQSNDYNLKKLGKFLKKSESRVSHVLSSNVGHTDTTNLSKSEKIPFSKGYFSLPTKSDDEKLSVLKYTKISHVIFSESKENLIVTVHKEAHNVGWRKSLVCFWDLSVARAEPIKYLAAIDEVVIGRFRGNIKGVFIAALDDGSIHLWDLTEKPTLQKSTKQKESTDFVDTDSSRFTEIERDREWNLKNSHVGYYQPVQAITLQSCSFTSSGVNLSTKDEIDCIVGLEIMNTDEGNSDCGQRIVGQILSLQRIGILTIWSIIQDKLKSSKDIGKAYLSKMSLEKCQTINLTEHIDISTKRNISGDLFTSFNLNAAKRRLSLRKKEKCLVKNFNSRPQTASNSKFDFDIDRPSSAASMRKRMLPVEINVPKSWETGVVCNDLKIMKIANIDNYLIARNCGEVLHCKRCLGTVKIERFSVASDSSSVTSLEVSREGLPYFLAATDTGTVNLCSLLDKRILLTLDCRNVPSSHESDKCISDSKGRFISSISTRRHSESIEKPLSKLGIKSVHWSHVNPCTIHVLQHDRTVILFELTHSDIYAKFVCENAAVQCSFNNFYLALLTPDGEVQLHKLPANESQTKENLIVFEKYVALL